MPIVQHVTFHLVLAQSQNMQAKGGWNWAAIAAVFTSVGALATLMAAIASLRAVGRAGVAAKAADRAAIAAESGLVHIRQREARDRAVETARSMFPALQVFISCFDELTQFRWKQFLRTTEEIPEPNPELTERGFTDLRHRDLMSQIVGARNESPAGDAKFLNQQFKDASDTATHEIRLAELVMNDHQIYLWLNFLELLIVYAARSTSDSWGRLMALGDDDPKTAISRVIDNFVDNLRSHADGEANWLTNDDVAELRSWDQSRFERGYEVAFRGNFGEGYRLAFDIAGGFRGVLDQKLLPAFRRYIGVIETQEQLRVPSGG